MTEKAITRVALLEEATKIEAAGGDWRIRHVCAVLDCHRTTLYRDKWLKSRMIHGVGGTTMRPSDIRLYQANHMGRALQRAN